jgi:hypothetical protein
LSGYDVSAKRRKCSPGNAGCRSKTYMNQLTAVFSGLRARTPKLKHSAGVSPSASAFKSGRFARWWGIAISLALLVAPWATASQLTITAPVWQGTNLVFALTNPTPECSCQLLNATNLATPTPWTIISQGAPYQTNFTVPYSATHQGFFELRYNPFLQVPSSLAAIEDTLLSITNLQLAGSSSLTGGLSLAVSHGAVKFA